MRIAHEFAGYTLAEADLLRRGISKKDKNILDSERKRFIEKCKIKNYSDSIAEEIYDYIVKFADYGFNRSHSVAYSLVAYQMAYLKANYFPIFMTVLLSSVTGNEGVTSEYINEIRKQQIPILPPDINKSTDQYIYDQKSIYLPLLAIKSLGKIAVNKIMEERKKGEFKDYQNFKLRMKKDLNDKNLEMLIHSGALDSFKLNHKTMNYHKQIDDAGYEQYITDFKLMVTDDYAFAEKAQFEKDALGFNIVYHPINAFQDVIKKYKLKTLSVFEKELEANVLAFIRKVKVIKTKAGKEMAFVELDDGSTQMEATLFSETYEKYASLLTNDVQIFKIRVNDYKNQKTFLIEQIKKMD
jgi:DNA polymerase-3 subunit alpha